MLQAIKRSFRALNDKSNLSASFSIFPQLDRPSSSKEILELSAKQIRTAMRRAFNEQVKIERHSIAAKQARK